ncbi:type I restriction enzyme S subunit [Paenibacillus taihuensis]|uniref:Type I restriction enzyme S subunit n=1 Tax=Paenibacillus taihuensis TaxID=1156355 RepID=A0A3D9S6W7_9BACL|nr:restriction endonuclease subunit S [Paenibacillus taihuensis]REE84555.1 type I restriction enzyme S subunit [Paenibacillus taihuensis]
MAKYRFEEIAYNSTEKKKPVEEDRFTYIGLEHLDPGTLKVTRYGSDVAPTGEKLVMKEGDVLFGKRRAYQKKVAISPFDGIFSAHGMVLRPRENVIDKDFFPLLISSDYFLDAAIKISVGSLSPTINWGDLKILEFELPPLAEQRKLAKALRAINDTIESYRKLLTATEQLVKSHFIEMFGDPITNPLGWQSKPLLETGTCKNGINYTSNESGIKIHCLGVGDFKDLSEIRDTSVLPTITLNSHPSEEYLLQNGDIVFVRSNGNKELVGRCLAVYPEDSSITYSGFCIRYRLVIDSLKIPYLLQVFKSNSVRQNMVGRGANIQNLNQKILSEINIPIPPIELQNQFEDFVQQADKSKFELEQALKELDSTYKRIFSENLG